MWLCGGGHHSPSHLTATIPYWTPTSHTILSPPSLLCRAHICRGGSWLWPAWLLVQISLECPLRSGQIWEETELCGSRVGTISPRTLTAPGQSPPFTWPDLGLFKPDELCWTFPDVSLRPAHHEGQQAQAGTAILVHPGTFAE